MGPIFFKDEEELLSRYIVLSISLAVYSWQVFAAARLGMISTTEIPKIRVMVARSLPQLEVTGLDVKRDLFVTNDVRLYQGKKTIEFKCAGVSALRKQKGRPVLLASLTSETGLLTLGRERYQGRLLLLGNPQKESCDVVNEIPMESYIAPLLAKEMRGDWPVEALKAQAVAARSYALEKIESQEASRVQGHNTFYDVESSEKHQVGGTFFDITDNTMEAARGTRGEILVVKGTGKLTPMFFHAECGGDTFLPEQVWGNKVAGYQSVACPDEMQRKDNIWKVQIPNDTFKKFLNWVSEKKFKIPFDALEDSNQEFVIAPDKLSSLKVRIYFGENVLVVGKMEFKRFFGRITFPSNHFMIRAENGKLYAMGRGLGHGVGMSQMGAKYLAEKGWNYRQILDYYYPGHTIKKIY